MATSVLVSSLVCFIVAPAGLATEVGRADDRRAETAKAVEASNRFGFDLYRRIKQDHDNVICSPVSASIALTMTAAGARGKTLSEMATVLHLDEGHLPDTHRSFAQLLGRLNGGDGRDGLALRIADRLWGQRGYAFRPGFLDLLRVEYGAPLELVDFARASGPAGDAINRWAADQTHNRIREILPPGALNERARLVLTNAIYFKARWSSPFARAETARRRFTTPSGKRMVATMRQVGSARYAKLDGLALIELQYKGGLSMLILLPDSVDGLDGIEDRLAAGYDGWRAALQLRYVDLQLPRWKVTTQLSLANVLASMGMPTAFGPRADFGGMLDGRTGEGALAIDRVLQQAFVSVDEAGTEAAAVTVVQIGFMSKATATPVSFHADHPFMYVIADRQTGAVLFVGRVREPER
jgi:serpin B